MGGYARGFLARGGSFAGLLFQGNLPAQKAENGAGGKKQRQHRYPDQHGADRGEQNRGGKDADDQHDQRNAERSEPRHIEAMCATGS